MICIQPAPAHSIRWYLYIMTYVCIAPLTQIHAESIPRPPDFAYGLPVTVQHTAPLQEINIPQRVYEVVTRDDLSDVRVFNHDGDVLPHSLRTPAAATTSGKTVSLPFFPLFSAANTVTETITLHFRADQNGTVLDLRNGAPASPPSTTSASYLIDASSVSRGIDKLILSWSVDTPYTLNALATLESSHDLAHWRPVNGLFPILRLRHGDATIERRTLLLPSGSSHYYLLKFSPPALPIDLTAVQAQLASEITPASTEWKTLIGVKDANQPAEFEYNTGGTMPVDRIQVKLAHVNTVASVEIQSAANQHGPWAYRASGLIYRISSEGQETEQEELILTKTPSPHRLFKLIVKEGIESLGRDAPALVVGWTPHRLTFMVRGNPPYLLAYGNIGIVNSQQGVANLFKTLPASPSDQPTLDASLGVEQPLGGDIRRLPAPLRSNIWKKAMLWLSLLSGVTILIVMALRLARTMRASAPPKPNLPS